MSPLPILLASQSPRRSELLAAAGLDFVVRPADVDERPLPGEQALDMVQRVARDKARAVRFDGLVIAADTIVVRDGVILGKPRDDDDAIAMLRSLSGRRHQVVTGFAVVGPAGEVVDAVVTQVVFRPLPEAVVRAYVATGEPHDKAGSYGIQAGAAKLVQRIEGSYTNVVGLPLVEVLDAVAGLGGPRL